MNSDPFYPNIISTPISHHIMHIVSLKYHLFLDIWNISTVHQVTNSSNTFCIFIFVPFIHIINCKNVFQ